MAEVNNREYNERCQKIKELEQNLTNLQKEFSKINKNESSLIKQAEEEYENKQMKHKKLGSNKNKPNYELDNPFRLHIPVDSGRSTLSNTSGLEVQQKTDEAQNNDKSPS